MQTRSQASKAARFREYSQELRDLWAGLAADDYRHHSETLATEEADALARSEKLSELADQLAQLQAVKTANEQELSQVDGQLRRQQQQTAEKREMIAACESTIRHQTGRSRELEHEGADTTF